MGEKMPKEQDYLICRCEEISLGEINAAIEAGYDTLDDIKRYCRAGMGLCQGRSCTKVIARLISQKTGKPLEEVLKSSYRFPVRPEKLSVLTQEVLDEPDN